LFRGILSSQQQSYLAQHQSYLAQHSAWQSVFAPLGLAVHLCSSVAEKTSKKVSKEFLCQNNAAMTRFQVSYYYPRCQLYIRLYAGKYATFLHFLQKNKTENGFSPFPR
jgi:hypothetical protein